jgi:PTH1 family peptidyl-tRNA hydrolase
VALLVGLGNPGKAYTWNRHNVGFMAVDGIAQKHHFPGYREQFGGLVCQGRIELENVILFKPSSFMNESGRPVGLVARFFKVSLSDILVMHDDLDLERGRVRVKTGGGAGGHNGLKSIDSHIGKGYGRLRIGIGRPDGGKDASDYVLSNFGGDDQVWLDSLIPAIALVMPDLLHGNAASFCNKISSSTRSALPDKISESTGYESQ